jgi:hypothetical protein
VYTLQDLYVIFRQEPTVDGKVELLREWKQSGYKFHINWNRLIQIWSRHK